VNTDLSFFDLFVPCGITDVVMTSTQRELGPAAPTLAAMESAVAASFASTFALIAVSRSRAELDAMARHPASVGA